MKQNRLGSVLLLLFFIISITNADDKENTAAPTDQPDCINCDVEIPIELGNKINQYDTYSDFIQNMIDLDTIDQRDQIFLLANSSTDEIPSYERSIAIRPKPAACIPDVAIVSLRPEDANDPTMVYFPSCTRVKRCGGCCSHKLLSCQPTAVQQHAFEVKNLFYR